MPETITKAQQVFLNVIKLMRFNEMDGENVYATLVSNSDKWIAVYPTVYNKLGLHQLLPLRDLDQGFINMDRIYIKTHAGYVNWICKVFKKELHADSVCMLTVEEAEEALGAYGCEDDFVILYAWWD